jgi:hypothetical protein
MDQLVHLSIFNNGYVFSSTSLLLLTTLAFLTALERADVALRFAGAEV